MRPPSFLQAREMQWWGWPALLVLLIVGADVADGTHGTVDGLFVAVPFVASTSAPPRIVAVWGALAVVAAALLGVVDHSYTPGLVAAQAERLALIAATGALAVQTARRRVRREAALTSAGRLTDALQDLLLATPPALIDGLRIAVSYRSAGVDYRVGGDLYDVRSHRGVTRVVIGDVQGKGLDAVKMAGVVLAAFREHHDRRDEPAALLADLDRAVSRETAGDDEMFVTALVADICPDRSLVYASAGHPPPLLVRDGQGLLLAPGGGLPLGVGLGDHPAGVQRSALRPGDRLLLYTDGTTEARSPTTGEEFPLVDHAPVLAVGTIADGLTAVEAAVDAWSGGRLHDDAALVAIE
ncbi:MAG TPA: PP2C family protein-serine/threonine phosphatase, partial [Acidimicrobiales bacterium]|nr:PP2C family protein-serine/threonine phosphatase [Acidimicrobiales bacterium]